MFKSLEKITASAEAYRPEEFYRYLGLAAILESEKTSEEFIRQQVVTELAESLDAPMATNSKPVRLKVLNRELIDIDGRGLVGSSREWANMQISRARVDKNLNWFSQIALIEAEEQEEVVRFANTSAVGSSMLVISPFPEEPYADIKTRYTVQKEGFRPDIRRAFLRVYQKTESGIEEHIQSVDSSSLVVWNSVISESFNQPFANNTAQLLQRRLMFQSTEPKVLIEKLCAQYDEILSQRDNQKYKYGRAESFDTEASIFVESYPAIISDTICELKALRTNNKSTFDSRAARIFYDSKALLHAAYAADKSGESIAVSGDTVRALRHSEGGAAASLGKSFAGCSGANGAELAGDSANISATSTLSMGIKYGIVRNGIEAVDCVNCPGCTLGVGYRDPRTKKWLSCGNGGCKNYSLQVVNKFKGVKNKPTEQKENIIIESFRFWGINI